MVDTRKSRTVTNISRSSVHIMMTKKDHPNDSFYGPMSILLQDSVTMGTYSVEYDF